MSRRAFTLVELLVVIGIMVILMSLIMGGVMLAKRSAQRAKAVSLLGAVASAIDQYRSNNSMYPESWKIPATPPADWTTAQGYSSWLQTLGSGDEVFDKAFNGVAATAVSKSVWEGINVQLAYQLGSLVSDQVKNGKMLDPWGNPLRYRPSKWYAYDAANTTVRIDGASPPGEDNYQLWSSGPDGKDDANPGEGGDDIPLWAKKQP